MYSQSNNKLPHTFKKAFLEHVICGGSIGSENYENYDLTSSAKSLSYPTKDLGMLSSIDHYYENKPKNVPFFVLLDLTLREEKYTEKII